MITDNQARAIRMIDATNGGYVIEADYDKMWFRSAVKPQLKSLEARGYIRSNGFDKEYVLTAEGREAYSRWYQAKGFNMGQVIDGWLEYASVE